MRESKGRRDEDGDIDNENERDSLFVWLVKIDNENERDSLFVWLVS